ncbi:AfsR/SARP family transcriptional regulator [Mycobacterium decipiens]|uniref:AfsR family transcriptional regulator n=1 Tax=Mycobacterium decipiens TaxID=1430326 RepID=A0A1X2LSU7_9MYCO|nr:BTAD domain-containing putative transcriptional regulator [Mycobacterium decipiens]OSC39873.1 AfsR family transcriptional regulator [Mycobacterium decipiens]
MTVEFRLFGGVRVLVDGRRVDIGPARQRCVLAALLVDVNRPVPLHQLVDRIWSDRPPHRARNALAVYVCRLRDLLADAEEVTISRDLSGYVLTADPLSVDLHRFRSVISQARASVDPHVAAGLFDRALAIWSGEPFVLLDTPWINDVRTAMQAERFSAQLDRNDVALRVGRHDALLVELSAAFAAHPLNERLAGQLMLAQYRSGRQHDALDTYRRIRERLVNELGVDPGPALRQVHQQILTGETEAPVTTAAAAPVDDAVLAHSLTVDRPQLAQLRRATSFVGHEHELGRITDALLAGPLVTLTGVGGVGKTRLAAEVARREQQRFGEGVWICELGPLEQGNAVGQVVAAAGRVWRQQGLDLEESVIEYLRAHEVLLLLDNCEHVLEAAARLVTRIMQNCPRVSVLATSRQPLGVEGEQIVVVPSLPEQDAVRLFADRARASRPDFTLDDQPAGVVAEICRRVDCLPLGVELAAARMRVMSTLDVARRLDDLRLLDGGMRGVHPRQQSLTATIAWSYRMLTEAEQSFFARLSLFAGTFDLEAAHRVCGADGTTEHESLSLLSGLVDKSMVVVRDVTDWTRYGVLETLRAFGRERLQESGIDAECTMRHAVYFAELAERAGAGMQSRQERDWVERVLPDYDNLRAAFVYAMDQHDTDLALRLGAATPEFLGWRMGYAEAELAEQVIAVADPEHPLFPTVVGAAARVAWNHADFSHAKSLAALARGRRPLHGTARVVYPSDVLADIALFEGDPLGARSYWEAEAQRARTDADPIRLAWTLYLLAICQALLGNPDTALSAAREAVEVADRTANPTTQALAYFALGYLLRRSEPDRALALFDDAARLAAEVQNFWVYGTALMGAAATRAVHGDPRAAAQMLIAVLDHWDRFGDVTEQWVALRYVTRLLFRLGSHEEAAFLHYALVNAGKPPPLSASQLDVVVDRLGAAGLDAGNAPTGSAIVFARARCSLQWQVENAVVPVGGRGDADPSGL